MATDNAAGLALVKSFEGERLVAYPDPGTGGDPWTIGYGHTGMVQGVPVHPGMTITGQTANDLLTTDIQKFANEVSALVSINLTPNQFAALVSFQYNTGALGTSAGLPLLNDRKFEQAWDDHFCLYINKGTPVEAGLVRRRAAERALFFTP